MSVRRLITDADIRAGRVASPIVLDEGTLLTPAARDRAVAAGIEIVERGGVGATPEQHAAPAPVAQHVHRAQAAPASAAPSGPPPCSRCGGTLTPTETGCATCGRSPCACATDAAGGTPCGQSCDTCGKAVACEHASPAAAAQRPAAAVAASAAHTCARTDGLGDGLWLVRVENGVAVSVLPASGAGALARSRQL